MEVEYSKDVARLLKSKNIIKSANLFLKDPMWLQKITKEFSWFEEAIDDAGLENIQDFEGMEKLITSSFNNIDKLNIKQSDAETLRVYNDKACTFSSPILSKMRNLNDPMEGMWNFRDLSYATVLIMESLKDNGLLSACYTTASQTNQEYMINNYSKKAYSWMEFNKSEFDIKLDNRGDVLFGYVSYNKTQLNRLMAKIRQLLEINNKNNYKNDPIKYSIYLTFEIIFNLFYKWRKMKEEQEYRVIKIGPLKKKASWIIPVVVTCRKDPSHTPGSINPFYKLTDDVKDILGT